MRLPASQNNGRSEHTEALYLEHGAAVAALCRSLLRDRAEFEDATQQVFLSAHRSLLNGAVPREPLAWLLAIARHECYARLRQRAAAPVRAGEAPEVAAPDASVAVLRAGEVASLWEEVGRMPRTQREAFLLREIRGLSYGQLAAELSVSPPSVRSLLLRARTRLRHRLGGFAAAFGSTPSVQALLRLAVGGGDGASPLPATTKAIAVGLGALALTSAGDLPRVTHHTAARPGGAAIRHRSEGHARRVAAPPVTAVAPSRGNSRRRADIASGPAKRSDDHVSGSGFGSPGSSDGSRGTGELTPVSASDGSHDGTSSGSGGGNGSGGTTTTTLVQASSGDGGTDGKSGPDGGSDSVTTTTTSSSGSGGGSTDGGGTTDGGGSSDGG